LLNGATGGVVESTGAGKLIRNIFNATMLGSTYGNSRGSSLFGPIVEPFTAKNAGSMQNARRISNGRAGVLGNAGLG
jgi:hypothetical protein